jgi:uncharacterized Zn-binding protein involved in type VI secretion
MSVLMLHENATVLCLHSPGQAKPTVTDQRVKVSGQKIVTQPGPYTISGCILPTQAGGPCVTAQWTSAATRVKASGMPVLFKDSQATCIPTGTGVNIMSTQTRVKVT